jgi:hypothetical protein
MPVALVSARREMEPFSSLTLPMATSRQSLEVAVEESFLLLVFVANSAVSMSTVLSLLLQDVKMDPFEFTA